MASPSTRPWLLMALVSVLGWLVYLAVFAPLPPRRGSAPDLTTSLTVQQADFQWNLQDMNEQSVSFAKFRGRTVFLNIWATWCPPCVAEMPSIATLAGNGRLKDVAFVCVSVDDSVARVREYVQEKKWGMTILHATSLPTPFQTEGIPATFIIDPAGRIVTSEVGSAQWDTPEVVDLLEKLAKKPAAQAETSNAPAPSTKS